MKGFLQALKGAVLVPCTKHVRDNIESQLNSLRIEDEEKKNITSDIFGDHVNCKKGLPYYRKLMLVLINVLEINAT